MAAAAYVQNLNPCAYCLLNVLRSVINYQINGFRSKDGGQKPIFISNFNLI